MPSVTYIGFRVQGLTAIALPTGVTYCVKVTANAPDETTGPQASPAGSRPQLSQQALQSLITASPTSGSSGSQEFCYSDSSAAVLRVRLSPVLLSAPQTSTATSRQTLETVFG